MLCILLVYIHIAVWCTVHTTSKYKAPFHCRRCKLKIVTSWENRTGSLLRGKYSVWWNSGAANRFLREVVVAFDVLITFKSLIAQLANGLTTCSYVTAINTEYVQKLDECNGRRSFNMINLGKCKISFSTTWGHKMRASYVLPVLVLYDSSDSCSDTNAVRQSVLSQTENV